MKRLISLSLCLIICLSCLFSCNIADITDGGTESTTTAANLVAMHSLDITNFGERVTLRVGQSIKLETNAPEPYADELRWSASDECISVSQSGDVQADSVGYATVNVSFRGFSDSLSVTVISDGDADVTTSQGGETDTNGETDTSGDTPNEYDPTSSVDTAARDKFYGGADAADSHAEALERSSKGQLSGAATVPDQSPTLAAYRPAQNGMYVRNSLPYFVDDNTYVVVNSYGQEVFRVYRGGGYITLEEVAAYLYAFGEMPANYTSKKSAKPQSSIWGEYLRVNHTKFSGDTSRYPYEPKLPNISGCGGTLVYYEIDIGTTGTDCDPSYTPAVYNDGYEITRGAARIVYTVSDLNGNRIVDPNEKYLFYTYNHYNDFQEYLNYYGGWGEMFGNITGGGTISSKYDYNPTSYVPSCLAPLVRNARDMLSAASVNGSAVEALTVTEISVIDLRALLEARRLRNVRATVAQTL